MAIFSEEFTASVKSKVDSVVGKVKGVSKIGLPALLAGGLVGSTLLVGATAVTARHVVGSGIGNECRIASEAYIQLANDQEADINKFEGMLKQVEMNPWSAFGLMGPMTALGTEVKDRWVALDEAESVYSDKCVGPLIVSDFNKFMFNGYVDQYRDNKIEAEMDMENARDNIITLMDRLGW